MEEFARSRRETGMLKSGPLHSLRTRFHQFVLETIEIQRF
jgi:hypothetical protein